MIESRDNWFDRCHTLPRMQTVGFGAFLVAALVVAALILVALKLVNGEDAERKSLIPLDQPAAWSGFTA